MVLPDQTTLAHLTVNTFYAVKESQTCLVSIKQSEPTRAVTNNDGSTQRYIIYATIHDVMAQNLFVGTNQSIQYEDFIPPHDTRLRTLVNNSSETLEFIIVTDNILANVTVSCEEKESPISLQCAPGMLFRRLAEIVCRLWKVNPKACQLVIDEGFDADDDASLTETFETIDNIQIQLVASLADVTCTITYLHQTRNILAMNTTLGSEILEQAMNEFSIPGEETDSYKLFLFDDPESPTEIDADASIELMRDLLPEGTVTIPFQLIKQ